MPASSDPGRYETSTQDTHAFEHASVDDAEGYSSSVRGVEIEAVRIGVSDEPNHLATVSVDHLAVTAGHIGFPISHTAHTPDSTTIVARIHSAPVGSRWAGVPLRANQTLLYSPDVDHAGVDLPGTCFTFMTTEIDLLEQRADELGHPIERFDTGVLRDVTAMPSFRSISRLLDPIETFHGSAALPGNALDDMLSAFVVALGRRAGRRTRMGSLPDHGLVIRRCLDYAHSVGRRPSITELCLVAGVSERKLRDVFIAAFDRPPSVFFRAWALDVAHERLVSGEPIPGGVSDVALQTGFGHFGRFSRYYEEVFGELPSETYRAHRPTASRPTPAEPSRRAERPDRARDSFADSG